MNEKVSNSGTHIVGDMRADENSLDVAYRRNLQNDSVDFMSPVVEKITGFSAQEMIAMSSINKSFDLIHPDDRPLVTARLTHAIDIGFGTWSTGSNIRMANTAGSPITLRLSKIKIAGSSSAKESCAILPISKKQKKF